MTPIVEISNAVVERDGVRVFDRFSLTLNAGEHVAILGPNGAGKSTLLKLITREIYPLARDDTRVRVFGCERWDVWELRARLGIVSHDLQQHYVSSASGIGVILSGYWSSLTTWEHQSYNAEQMARADAVMQQLGIAHLRDRTYGHMSTGEQRRCLLGRALIHDPQVLVFDEPTSGLDLKACFYYIDTMRALIRAGKTVILITHHIHEIPPEVERVVLLQAGRVIGDGAKAALLRDAEVGALFDTTVRIVEEQGWYQVLPRGR